VAEKKKNAISLSFKRQTGFLLFLFLLSMDLARSLLAVGGVAAAVVAPKALR